jgi:hypothetical protein
LRFYVLRNIIWIRSLGRSRTIGDIRVKPALRWSAEQIKSSVSVTIIVINKKYFNNGPILPIYLDFSKRERYSTPRIREAIGCETNPEINLKK